MDRATSGGGIDGVWRPARRTSFILGGGASGSCRAISCCAGVLGPDGREFDEPDISPPTPVANP